MCRIECDANMQQRECNGRDRYYAAETRRFVGPTTGAERRAPEQRYEVRFRFINPGRGA